jgi:hypothetical protein
MWHGTDTISGMSYIFDYATRIARAAVHDLLNDGLDIAETHFDLTCRFVPLAHVGQLVDGGRIGVGLPASGLRRSVAPVRWLDDPLLQPTI